MTLSPIATLIGALGLLSGCALPLQGASAPPPSQAAVAACNTRADEQFLRQNRDTLYKSDTYQTSIRDSPYAGAGITGSTAGLSDQFDRNRDVRTCLNGVGTPIQVQQPATAAP